MDYFYIMFGFFSIHVIFSFLLYKNLKNEIANFAKEEMKNIVDAFVKEREKSIKQYQELLTNPVMYVDIIGEDQALTDDNLYNKNNEYKKKIFH